MISNDSTRERAGSDQMVIGGVEFRKGDKLRLNLGKRKSDALDIFLNGRIVTVETIYTDYEHQVYLGVTIDDDPWQEMHREMGIYHFFLPDEVEMVQV